MQPLKHIQLLPHKHTHETSSHTIWTYLSPVKLRFWGSSSEMLQAAFLAFCLTHYQLDSFCIEHINILDLILCSRSSPIKATWFMFCQLFTHAGLSYNEMSSLTVCITIHLWLLNGCSERTDAGLSCEPNDWIWIKRICRFKENPEGSSVFSNNRQGSGNDPSCLFPFFCLKTLTLVTLAWRNHAEFMF